MADRMLLIAWGAPVRGLESRAIEVFNEALGILGRMQQDGRIEGFDAGALVLCVRVLCVGRDDGEAAEAARVDEAELLAAAEGEDGQVTRHDAAPLFWSWIG